MVFHIFLYGTVFFINKASASILFYFFAALPGAFRELVIFEVEQDATSININTLIHLYFFIMHYLIIAAKYN